MRAAALLLVLLGQHATRANPGDQLAEAQRLRELALHDRAEEILRIFIKAAPADSQVQRWIPEFRATLCEVLLEARKLEDLKTEADVLRRNPKTRFLGLTLMAAGAWHAGHVAEAKELCDEAAKLDEPASAAHRRLAMIRSLLGWSRFETGTHIVHHPPGSPIAADVKAFGKRLDVAFDRVRAELDVPFAGKLEAFFFTDQAQADAIVERTLVSSLPNQRVYFARHDSPPGFAIAQVLSFYVANRRERRPPKLAGFCEGFYAAHADDPRWEARRDAIPRKLAADGGLPSLDAILMEPGRDAKDLAVKGHFVRWLIRTRGRELFRRFWTEYNELSGVERPDPSRPWVEIYGVTPGELEAAWRSSIR